MDIHVHKKDNLHDGIGCLSFYTQASSHQQALKPSGLQLWINEKLFWKQNSYDKRLWLQPYQ